MDEVVIGFTGTQKGMTSQQIHAAENLVLHLDADHGVVELHHGDCIGADVQMHVMFCQLIVDGHIDGNVVIHPPLNLNKRAWAKDVFLGRPLHTAIEVRSLPAKEYLDRNVDIVSACDLLVAAPRSQDETRRSGTWSTVRHARSAGKRVVLIYPEGVIHDEGASV